MMTTDQEKIKAYEEVLRDIATNYDHDHDAHQYDTHCRVCMAENVLEGKNPWENRDIGYEERPY